MAFDFVVPPREIIKEYMDAHGVSASGLAEKTELTPQDVRNLLSGRNRINRWSAEQLSKGIEGTLPQFWLDIQKHHRGQTLNKLISENAELKRSLDVCTRLTQIGIHRSPDFEGYTITLPNGRIIKIEDFELIPKEMK